MNLSTDQKSGLSFLLMTLTLTFDLLFKANWKTFFFVPQYHTTPARGLGCVFQRWPWTWPLTYFSRSTEKRVFSCPELTQHLPNTCWRSGCVFQMWPWPWPLTYFSMSMEKHVFFCPKPTQNLPEVLGAFFGGDLDPDLWPTFQGEQKNMFFVPRIPHNTCQRSGVRFSEVTLTLTFDLLFKVNLKTCFSCPEFHLPEVWGVFRRWPWPLTYFLRSTEKHFFVPRIPHNTCRRSGVRFSQVILTLTFDLLFKVNWKTCFFVPRIPYKW
jgi:hypothetical protein